MTSLTIRRLLRTQSTPIVTDDRTYPNSEMLFCSTAVLTFQHPPEDTVALRRSRQVIISALNVFPFAIGWSPCKTSPELSKACEKLRVPFAIRSNAFQGKVQETSAELPRHVNESKRERMAVGISIFILERKRSERSSQPANIRGITKG